MKEIDFGFYLTRFLATYLPSQRGIKKNTQVSYRDTFSLLLIYCKEQENIQPDKVKLQQLDRELINRFLNWLEETRNCRPATRNQRLAALHSFFRYLIIECPEKIEQCQQILNIPMKKAEQPMIRYLSLEGTKALLKQPDLTSPAGRRDSVLLALMYDTGCRVQELVDLRVCDIILAGSVTVKLTGKGGKSRMVPVMSPTGQLIRQYIEESHLDTPLYHSHPLFTNRSGKKMTRAGVTYILQKYAEQAYISGHEDVDPKLTPHCLRHSKAMHLLQSGVNLIYIRDLLGHSDVSTTEVYARADEKMKRSALENAYESPSDGKMPSWQEDNDLLNWLKNFGK